MSKIGKTFALFLILLIAMSCLTTLVKSVSVQSAPYPTPYPQISKPDVPQFTVRLIDSSYDIHAYNSTDPYTGQTVTHPSQHIEARTIEIRIENEGFTPFEVKLGTSNWTVYFQYNVRWKGHSEKDWHEIYGASNGFLPRDEGSETVYSNQGTYSSSEGLKMTTLGMYTTFPPNSQLDFQVQAMIGFVHRDPSLIGWMFTGETSDWSNTQTLTIPETLISPSPNIPEVSPLAILPLLISILLIATIILRKKHI